MVSAAFLFGIEVDFLISPYKGTFRVSQAYRNLRANGTYHQGYDLVGIGDKSIYCPVYGTVIRAGWECATLPKKGFGQRVVVRIGSTAYYMYFGHLSKINVAVGQKLKPGDLIGVEGSTGHSTGSHLHWEIRINDISTGYVSVHQYAGMDKPQSYYAFEVLYWCGIREGELLALTPADFDLDKGLLSITKSYQRLKGRDVITDPKTPKSVRVIQMPQFLTDEIRDYLKSFYKVQPDQRIFEVTKSYLHHEMDRGAKEAGVKRIRIHDLRHSHVSLLIEMGFSALAIADRVGHESVDITYKYAHLFPSKQQEMAQKLDMERREG